MAVAQLPGWIAENTTENVGRCGREWVCQRHCQLLFEDTRLEGVPDDGKAFNPEGIAGTFLTMCQKLVKGPSNSCLGAAKSALLG